MIQPEGLKYTTKIREYCNYIDRHLLNVAKAWEILLKALSGSGLLLVHDDFVVQWVDDFIREHDLSKFSMEEFIPYQQKFYPVGDQDPIDIKKAFQHHIDSNPHHYQNWTKIVQNHPNEHLIHLLCMVCDWMAMSMELGGSAEEYYLANAEKMDLPKWAHDTLLDIFKELSA